jgi:mannose-6-phosphate isomerase-like protein (cupin superfamily)
VSSISPIAAVCKSLTPSPEAASAAISAGAIGRLSHTRKLFHRQPVTHSQILDDSIKAANQRRRTTHQVQHRRWRGHRVVAPDATFLGQDDAGHTDDHYELFEVDAPRGPTTPLHRTGWAKAYYVLTGRMIVQVEDEAFDLGPGSSITIPPAALHTFTVLSPASKFLAMCMTGAMGRFQADLHASVPRDRPIEEVAQQLQEVLTRHDVTVVGFETTDLRAVP